MPDLNILERLAAADRPQKNDNNVITCQIDGYMVYVGKNAPSNEKMLTDHKNRHPSCLWMHAFDASGSHVVLCTEKPDISDLDLVIKKVSKMALEYSKSRGTLVRVAKLTNLFKPKGAGPGIWMASRYTTLEAL